MQNARIFLSARFIKVLHCWRNTFFIYILVTVATTITDLLHHNRHDKISHSVI
jgi:hypothetical protein